MSCLFSHGTFLIIWIAICGGWSYNPSSRLGNARKDYIKVMITNGGLSFSLTQTFYLIQPSTYFEQLFKIATYSVLSNIASLSNIKNVLWWFLLLWPNWPQIPKASRSLSSSAKETINELQRATHYPGKWICLVLTGYLIQNIIL